MKTTIVSCCAAACLTAMPASGATYYVDASAGNDAWAGTQSSPGASNGPWQSLGRVNAATLAPGDQVRLKCGNTWHETLALRSSGTAANPIYVGAYPSDCPSLPTIAGADPIPWTAWKPYAGAIYRAVLPPNLINNGTFDSGTTGWRAYAANGGASIAAAASCISPGSACISVTAGAGPAATLLSSERFALRNGSVHSVGFSLKAPSGSRIRIIVRRDDAPWDAVGLAYTALGTGAWQNITTSFAPTAIVANARLDFEIPPSTSISIDNVKVQTPGPSVRQAHVAGASMLRARHPNRTTTQYLPMAADADAVLSGGKYVSTYAVFGALDLPSGAQLSPGITIRTRTNAWTIDERSVTSVSGNRLYLNSPTSYPLKAGWGYYLTGALWALDQAGEWHFDEASNSLYVWMPDGAHPGSKVAVGYRDVGIDLSGKQHIVLESIAVRRTGTAIRLRGSSAVTLRNAQISDSAIDGIYAAASSDARIESNVVNRTGRHAISGIDPIGPAAVGMRVLNNQISESGVLLKDGQVAGSPAGSLAAILSGPNAVISGNRIVNSGYNAIYPAAGSTVSSNYIEGSCLVLDDCAGIYMYGAHNGTRVEGNLVIRIPGARDGKPQDHHSPTEARGIYLDEQSSGITVAGNIVVDADQGIHLHNAAKNRVQGNTLYGNRLHQLWLQATTNVVKSSGDVFDNEIDANTMVPTGTRSSVLQQTKFGDVSAFARYDDNRYSALKSGQTAQEIWSGAERLYTFPEWQAAKSPNGLPRYLDVHGSHVTPAGYASHKIVGLNQIPNGSLAGGSAGWSAWSERAPRSTLSYSACSVGPCLGYVSGGGFNLLSSPNFSVVAGNWYRVTFDLMTPLNGSSLVVGVRRGGGGSNGYEWLMTNPPTVYGATTWKRHAFVFQALKTVNAGDPVTKDWGARLDYTLNASGATANIANIEMVPVTPVGMALRTDALVNPSMQSTAVDCPATGTDAGFCSKYVRFADGSPVSWPYPLGPLGAEIIYSRGDTLSDADGDGIADTQDRCPGSPSGAQVNSLGCGIGQTPL